MDVLGEATPSVEDGEEQEIPRNQLEPWCVMYASTLSKLWSQEGTSRTGDACLDNSGAVVTTMLDHSCFVKSICFHSKCVRQWLTACEQCLGRNLGFNLCCGELILKQWLIQAIGLWKDFLLSNSLETFPMEIFISPKKSMGEWQARGVGRYALGSPGAPCSSWRPGGIHQSNVKGHLSEADN